MGFLLLQEYIFCRVLDIRVPQIMNSYNWQSYLGGNPLYFLIQSGFCEIEYSVVLFYAIEFGDCAQEREKERQKIQALYKVGKAGQFTFCFDEEEEKKREKATI